MVRLDNMWTWGISTVSLPNGPILGDRLTGMPKLLCRTPLRQSFNHDSLANLQHKRYVLHLLYANTINRGGRMDLGGGTFAGKASVEVIEDLLPLHNTQVMLRLDKSISKVTLVPEGRAIEFEVENNTLTMTIEEFTCHQMVELTYR